MYEILSLWINNAENCAFSIQTETRLARNRQRFIRTFVHINKLPYVSDIEFNRHTHTYEEMNGTNVCVCM